MRKRIVIFLSVVLCSLLIAPVVNILSSPNSQAVKWHDKAFLYNMDFASRWLSRALYSLGISTNPQQVIIGREGWLYLGDKYGETVSVGRRGQTASEIAIGQKIGAVAMEWEAWLTDHGVKLYRVMIAPNKESIYPEHLPVWAKPVLPSATDALIAGTGSLRYVDLRPPLQAAKPMHLDPVYYKTDTHWNFLGAGIAFRAFAQHVGRAVPELRWPSDDAFEMSEVKPRNGGDLAMFLRLKMNLSDSVPMIHALSLPIETVQYDFDSNQVIHRGGNPAVASPHKPLLVKSDGALNRKKVLWLRDSFGTALAPLMAATFTDVIQLHFVDALRPGGRFVELVETWKPDYVFITVVERSSRAGIFALPPVSPVVIRQRYDFQSFQKTVPGGLILSRLTGK